MQDKMTSGKRVAKASDDPAAAARAERALASISRTETSQRAVEASKVVMVQTESALGAAGDVLQRARELLVAAGNASYTDAERASIAGELRTLREQLLRIGQPERRGRHLSFWPARARPRSPSSMPPAACSSPPPAARRAPRPCTNLPLTTDGQAAWLSARSGNGVFVTSADAAVAAATHRQRPGFRPTP